MKLLLIPLAAALLLLSACQKTEARDNLTLRNDSATPLGSVELSGAGYSRGGCYADGSPIGAGDTFGFVMEPDEGGAVTLRVWDEGERTVAAEQTFELDFSQGNAYTVSYASGGLTLELSQDESPSLFFFAEKFHKILNLKNKGGL